jgi:transposase-like protein
MPKKTGSRYPEEFKAEAVQLARSSPEKSIRQLAYELGISDQTLRNWIQQAQRSTAAHGSPHPGNRGETGAFAWRVIRSQNHIILSRRYNAAISCASIGGAPSATRQAAEYALLVQSMEKER